jgi:hypothetical protein
VPERVALRADVKFKTQSGSLSGHTFVRFQKLALSFDHYHHTILVPLNHYTMPCFALLHNTTCAFDLCHCVFTLYLGIFSGQAGSGWAKKKPNIENGGLGLARLLGLKISA